ncbi:MAG TPA: hypothetical protein VED63_01520 [Acidimicrobiales bacterium]|nr:hypothetical protein [Acidimicrobiales bacterium]
MAAPARRLSRLLAGVLVLVGGLLVFVKPARGLTLLTPSVTGFVQAAPDVWVERGASELTRSTVLREVGSRQTAPARRGAAHDRREL